MMRVQTNNNNDFMVLIFQKCSQPVMSVFSLCYFCKTVAIIMFCKWKYMHKCILNHISLLVTAEILFVFVSFSINLYHLKNWSPYFNREHYYAIQVQSANHKRKITLSVFLCSEIDPPRPPILHHFRFPTFEGWIPATSSTWVPLEWRSCWTGKASWWERVRCWRDDPRLEIKTGILGSETWSILDELVRKKT